MTRPMTRQAAWLGRTRSTSGVRSDMKVRTLLEDPPTPLPNTKAICLIRPDSEDETDEYYPPPEYRGFPPPGRTSSDQESDEHDEYSESGQPYAPLVFRRQVTIPRFCGSGRKSKSSRGWVNSTFKNIIEDDSKSHHQADPECQKTLGSLKRYRLSESFVQRLEPPHVEVKLAKQPPSSPATSSDISYSPLTMTPYRLFKKCRDFSPDGEISLCSPVKSVSTPCTAQHPSRSSDTSQLNTGADADRTVTKPNNGHCESIDMGTRPLPTLKLRRRRPPRTSVPRPTPSKETFRQPDVLERLLELLKVPVVVQDLPLKDSTATSTQQQCERVQPPSVVPKQRRRELLNKKSTVILKKTGTSLRRENRRLRRALTSTLLLTRKRVRPGLKPTKSTRKTLLDFASPGHAESMTGALHNTPKFAGSQADFKVAEKTAKDPPSRDKRAPAKLYRALSLAPRLEAGSMSSFEQPDRVPQQLVAPAFSRHDHLPVFSTQAPNPRRHIVPPMTQSSPFKGSRLEGNAAPACTQIQSSPLTASKSSSATRRSKSLGRTSTLGMPARFMTPACSKPFKIPLQVKPNPTQKSP